jgi:copper chaperone CopZ
MGIFEKKSVTYHVAEMNCGHCEKKISTALEGVAGIKKVKATSSNKQLVIEYRGEAPVDLASVNAVLEPAGYIASDVESV